MAADWTMSLMGVLSQLPTAHCRLSARVCLIYQLLEAGWRSPTVGINSVSYLTQVERCLQGYNLSVA